MTRGRRRVLLTVWAFVVIGLAVRALAAGLLAPASELGPRVTSRAIDVNRATVGELTTLPGIGVTRAEAIVLDRIRHGAFRGVDDLTRVDGLGPETVERLRPFVVLVDGERAR